MVPERVEGKEKAKRDAPKPNFEVANTTRHRRIRPSLKTASQPPTANCCSAVSGFSWPRRPRRRPPASRGEPQAIQQTFGHRFQTAEQRQLALSLVALLYCQIPQQTSPSLDQLQQHMGYLQQQVIHFPRLVAIGVLQVQAAGLLRIVTFIFDTPTSPSSLRRHFDHRLACHLQGRQPRPRRLLPVFIDLFALNSVHRPITSVTVCVAEAVHPAVFLTSPLGCCRLDVLIRTQLQQALKVGPQRWRSPWFEHVDVVTMIVLGGSGNLPHSQTGYRHSGRYATADTPHAVCPATAAMPSTHNPA